MSWDYLYLKQQLLLSNTRLLDIFEQYCINSYDNISRFEWSCKFHENDMVSSRFIHLSSVHIPPCTMNPAFVELLHAIPSLAERLPMSNNLLNEIVTKHTERINVCYESSIPDKPNKELIKIYFQLISYNKDLWNSFHDSTLGMPSEIIPGTPGIMYCLRIPIEGPITQRFYIAYDSKEYEDQSVKEYMQKLVSNRTLRFLQSYSRSMLNSDNPKMLYVSMKNSEQSEMMALAREIAYNTPLLSKRLNKITWVGLPEIELNVDMPKIFNIYVNLYDKT